MAKGKQTSSIPNKEAFGRMNFLFQASMLMAKNNTLSAYYGRQCRSISKKTLLRMSPDLKRNFCKRCSLAQQPGITTDLEIIQQKVPKSKKNKNIDAQTDVQMICRKCNYQRKFHVNPNYKFWLENPESLAEEIKSKNNKEKTTETAKTGTEKAAKISDAISENIT